MGHEVAALLELGVPKKNITIIDNDNVELSNLQRQVIHSTQNIGRPKVDSAESFIEKITCFLLSNLIFRKKYKL